MAAHAVSFSVEELLPALSGRARFPVRTTVRIGRTIEGLQESEQSFLVRGARLGAEHGLRQRFLNGSAQVLLPAMPGPRPGMCHIAEGGRQLRVAVGIIVQRVK